MSVSKIYPLKPAIASRCPTIRIAMGSGSVERTPVALQMLESRKKLLPVPKQQLT
jgi:hypothetical protein